MDAWLEELEGDDDCEFLLDGVKNGFKIVSNFDFVSCECNNYNSVLDPAVKGLVEAQISEEIVEGRYCVVDDKPTIVSALGAIRKNNGKVRLIHDASRPCGLAMNEYAEILEKQRFQSVDDAVKALVPNAYMVKIDLKSAYRSVAIHPDCFQATGLKWSFQGDDKPTYLVDTRLPFGSKLSPMIFHRLTQAVRRMMARRGFHNVIVYLDDFLIVERSLEDCAKVQLVLQKK